MGVTVTHGSAGLLFDHDDTSHPGPPGHHRIDGMIDSDALVAGLTPPQRDSVVHRGGPLLIVAGAGSGKTRGLTRRLGPRIACGRSGPRPPLASSFPKKAADEVRRRVVESVGERGKRMWFSTFHSAGVRILRAHGERPRYKRSVHRSEERRG